MHVDIDANGVITYDRKLRNGSGSAVYGLEVCVALGMPDDFVKLAHKIRRHVQNVHDELIDTTKASRYNSSVYISTCEVCKKNPACDTHHIKYQVHGGDNKSSNLVGLCKTCHDEEHNGALSIKGFVATSEGRKLIYVWEHEEKPQTSQENNFDDIFDDILLNQLTQIKQYVKYTIAGWHMRRTSNGKWQPVHEDRALAYVYKKVKMPGNAGTVGNVGNAEEIRRLLTTF
jgi:hypothetical protein